MAGKTGFALLIAVTVAALGVGAAVAAMTAKVSEERWGQAGAR